MKPRDWKLILGAAAFFLAATVVLNFYPNAAAGLISAAWAASAAVWKWAVDKLFAWQTLAGGILATLAVAGVAFVTLDAENRRRKKDEDVARRRLARVLRFEIKGALDVMGRAMEVAARCHKRGGRVRMPPFHLHLPAYTQSMNSLALLEGDLLDHLMRFHNGLWTYHNIAPRLDGEVIRKHGLDTDQGRAYAEFSEWFTTANNIGRHLDEVHLLRLELEEPAIEWGEPFNNWPGISDDLIASIDAARR